MALVIDTFHKLIPARAKNSSSGWKSFNAPCCQHRGHRADKRGRGGIRFDTGIVYHCFNCHYTTGWQPGNTLSEKFKTLCHWLGARDADINQMIFDALKTERVNYVAEPIKTNIIFEPIKLPEASRSFAELIDDDTVNDDTFAECVAYVANRGFNPISENWWWSPALPNRVIIPFVYNKAVVGYTARKIGNRGVKYLQERPANFVFNVDVQEYKQRYIIVCEGPFDAKAVDGVALLTNTISDQQAQIIDSLDAEVIVVPDQDIAGLELIEKAIKYNWSVAFPTWDDDVNDVAEAVNKYGKLFVLVDIIKTAVHGEIKLAVATHQFEHKIKRIEQNVEI